MASLQYGTPGSVINAIVNADIASLAVATLSAYAALEIDNTSVKATMAAANLKLGSAAFVAGNLLLLYGMPSRDLAGAAYPTLRSFSAEALQNYLLAAIAIPGTTAAQEIDYFPVRLLPGKFKLFAATNTGTPSLASTGNSLDLYPLKLDVV